MIDVSAVQAFHSEADVREVVDVALRNDFIAVHALPAWTLLVAELLSDRPDIMVGAPVGFPAGGNATEIKISEVVRLLQDGANEIDVMMNVGKLKSGDDSYVRSELGAIRKAAGKTPLKVIIETPYLTRDEVIRATRIAVESGADFVKTGTGWTGKSADMETIETIVENVGNRAAVKAAGGIRSLSTLAAMYRAGVRRFGINTRAAVAILQECDALPDGTVSM
jgi:deoxyribose-phosphate aldolase